jgi:hypothetical protein
LGRALVTLPQEVAVALWRLIVLLILLVLLLLRLFWELLRRLFGGKEHESSGHKDCSELPPHIKRKPDPCIYSQTYRMSQGLSVTWDNPDIEIKTPGGALAQSSNLTANTDYVVHARISNASFDPALATEVRCFYRPYSFNDPERTPIEFNPDGTEKVVLLHIAPWQSEIALFNWHTPDVEQAHYCLQVECRHPDDKNPNNNLGQENTNVIGGSPGETITTQARLVNREEVTRRFRILADAYRIPEGKVTLDLKVRRLPLRSRRRFDALYNLLMTHDPVKGGLRTKSGRAPVWISYAYTGFDALRKANARGQFPIPPEWQVVIDDQALDGNGVRELTLAGGEAHDVALKFTVPAGAEPGTRMPLNFTAVTPLGKIAGGVTLIVEVGP